MVYLSVKPSADLLATAAWLADPFLSTMHQAARLVILISAGRDVVWWSNFELASTSEILTEEVQLFTSNWLLGDQFPRWRRR